MESLSRPFSHHRRKLSTASSGNGFSFSGKNEYENILSGGNKKTKLRRGVVMEDYGEIFGGGGVRGSSIPVLDLSDLDRLNGSGELSSSNGQLDYSRIFGGLARAGDGNSAGAVPPYDELFGGAAYKSEYEKAKPQETARIGSPMKGLDNLKDSDHDRGCFSEVSDQNVGSPTKGLDNLKDSDHDMGCLSEASDQNVDGSKTLNMSYHKTSQQCKDGTNGTRHVAQLNAVPGFTFFVNGDTDKQKQDHDNGIPDEQLSDEKSGRRAKWKPENTRHVAQLNAVPGFTFFVNGDTDKQKHDHDNGIPDEQLSDEKSGRRAKWKPHDTDVSEDIINGVGSTDRDSIGVNRKLFFSGEIDVKPLNVPQPSTSPIDQSRPKGKPFYSGELDKAWSSSVPPPSSSWAKFDNDKVHLNQSKSFAFGSKVDPLEKDAGDHLTPSDEELDVDSAAAVSVAAMKKAIQQAQESIRLAKGLTDWKQDSMKMRSRSALKVKDVRETKHDLHNTSISENNMKDACSVVDTKAPVSRELDQNIGRENAEVLLAVKDRGALLVNRKIDGQKQEENAEAVEGGMSTWFTHLLNNGKNKMAAFASQLVDKKNEGILPEKSNQIEDVEMTKSEKAILEKNNSEKTETVARIVDPKDAVSELSTFNRATDFHKNVICDTGVLVKEGNLTPQVDETTRKMHNKFERGMSYKELEDSQETTDSKKLEYGNREKDQSFIELVEWEDEVNMSFKLEKKKMLDAVSGLEENKCTLDAVDAVRNVDDFCQVIGTEGQPRAPTGNGNDEKQLEDVLEIRLECYNMHETVEQMPLHSHDVVNPTFSMEECLQARPSQRITNKNEHAATDCGHGGTADIVENQETDGTKEHKENECAEGEIGEDKEIFNTSAWLKYTNNNHINVYQCDIDDVNIPRENSELCGLETNICTEQKSLLEVENSLNGNILAGHEKQSCQLEGRNNEGNYDHKSEGNENEVKDETEESLRSKESEVCETSYLNQNSEEGDVLETLGTNSEGNEDLVCEEDEKQAEQASGDPFWLKESELCETSYMDQNNEEGDVLETIGSHNEANGDLECEVDTKEVEQAVEGAFRLKQNENFETSYLDQNNVQGDDAGTIFQDVSEALASDSKIDHFGFAATTHEELMHEGLPTDVDLLKTSAFIHVGTEDHDIENDRDDKPPPSEKSSLNCCFIDTNGGLQIGKNGEGPNFVPGPEKYTTGVVLDACTENIMEDVNASKREAEKDNNVKDHQENDWIEKHEEPNSGMPNVYEGSREHLETDSVIEKGQNMECNEENLNRTERDSVETREAKQKETGNDNYLKKIEVIKRERERQNDRIAVERAIREARERAFAEARERAERAAVEKANTEARQRAMSEAREKLGKVASGTKISTDKSSTEAKLKAERAAVERATAEARERALEKAMSQKTDTEARPTGGRLGVGKSPSVCNNTGIKHSVSSPDLGRIDESNTESALRRKARLDRHQRIMDRAAKALAEKNMRDILAQREQSEINKLAETLDAEIKRWASGKEGNLRALLSTLQYILGANSGWQPITLTEIITTSAVKKAYRKATLYVHPDKLQQKGASIQQKYICEKVFDLLQAARNKFNSEER